jgi:hypothetical protein
VATTPLVRIGDPAQQIIAVTDEMNAASIVVGDRGLDPAGHYVLNSIPAAIALRASGGRSTLSESRRPVEAVADRRGAIRLPSTGIATPVSPPWPRPLRLPAAELNRDEL